MSVRELWRGLEPLPSDSRGWVAIRVGPDEGAAVLAAIRIPDRAPALLLEADVEALPSASELPRAQGLSIYPEQIEPGPRGRTRICVVLVAPAYRGVFEVLAEDLAGRVMAARSQREGMELLFARLRTWQSFLEQAGIEGLGPNQQAGLLGELLIMERLLDSGYTPTEVVRGWTGPSDGVQDFRVADWAVEVKATTRLPPVSFTVSNLAQLDERSVRLLVLAHVELALVEKDGVSLAEVASSMNDRLAAKDAAAADTFITKLLAAGYSQELADRYRERRYEVRGVRWFRVTDAFPRLRPGDVPRGIPDCRYAVEISACGSYEQDGSRVLELLRGGDQ